MHPVPQNVTLFTNKPGNIRNCRQPTEAERGREQNLEKKIWYTGQHLGWMKHFSAHTGTFYISFKLFVSLCYKDPKHLATLTEAGHSPTGQKESGTTERLSLHAHTKSHILLKSSAEFSWSPLALTPCLLWIMFSTLCLASVTLFWLFDLS